MKKETLVIIESTPCSNSSSNDGIAFVMAASAFEMPTKLLLLDNGILNLINNQEDFTSFLKAADLYEFNPIYICEEDLQKYNLDLEKLIVKKELLKIIKNKELCNFIKEFEHIIQY